jgi:hypothetical protein
VIQGNALHFHAKRLTTATSQIWQRISAYISLVPFSAKIQLCECQDYKVLSHFGTLVSCMSSLLASNATTTTTTTVATATTTITTLPLEVVPLLLLRW